MTELDDRLKEMWMVADVADRIASYWCSYGMKLDDRLNGHISAGAMHQQFPHSTAAELLEVTRASGVIPTEHELEGWEQFWVELGLDSQPEVEQTTEEEDELSGWHQPPLPGLESM